MVDNPFTRALGIIELGRISDTPTATEPRGGRILDWLSAMINAFVDIAKDPYIVRLNVNSWTYNMTSFLLRTGKGKQTFYFMCQPILKEIADAVLKTKGKYGIDRTKTPTQLENEAIQSVLDRYDADGKLQKKYDYIIKDPQLAAREFQDLFTTYFDEDGNETSRLRNNLFSSKQSENPLSPMEEQVRVYYAWKALKPYADSLANLVKYSKIDTKKTGKSFAEQEVYYNGMIAMQDDPNFELGAVERFYNETFIRVKTDNAIPFGRSIFSNMLFRCTRQFSDNKNLMLSQLGRKDNANNQLLNPIIKGMEAQIKSKFFNDFVGTNDIDVWGMFTGKRSMAKRIDNFKQGILKGNPKLSHLLTNGEINNDFVNFLIPHINKNNGIDFIDTSMLLDVDQASANNLINYWRELIDDPNPDISNLFKDLVVYAFYTSGDNATMNSFFQYVPNSHKQQIGYIDFIRRQLNDFINDANRIDTDDIYLNNWQNDKIVKPVDWYAGRDNVPLMTINQTGVNTPNVVIGVRHGQGNPTIRPLNWLSVQGTKFPIFPPYIKMHDYRAYDVNNWHVYKLIGYSEMTDENNRFTYIPVYGLVQKKGYKKGGNTIVEYGRETDISLNREIVWNYENMFNNLDKLLSMVPEDFRQIYQLYISTMKRITELPSYMNQNYAKLEQDRVYDEDNTVNETDNDLPSSDNNSAPLAEAEEPRLLMEVREELRRQQVDINNTENTNNDPVNFSNQQESIATIESDKTILSNEELRKIRPYTGTGMPRIAVASEHTDPVFFSQRIIDILDGKLSVEDKFRNASYSGNDFAALYLITKHDGLPLKKLLEYKIPKIIHFSITGLGGTKYEPGVMKADDLLDRIADFIKQGLDPEMVTVRIDPIIPGVTPIFTVENIVKRASEMGIKNIRFSIMDQYKTTKQFMEQLGYDYSLYYDGNSLHAKPEVQQRIASIMLGFKEKYGVNLSTCAEPMAIPGISKEACLSVSAVNNALGTSISETATGKQRQLCSCYGGKTDLLRYDNKCASSCVYCYAHHNANANAMYYNADGTLKDTPLTRTKDVNSQQLINNPDNQIQSVDNLLTTDEEAIRIMDLYDYADKQIKPILDSMELTEDERVSYQNDLARMIRNENPTTREEVMGIVNKLICNL